MDDDLPELDEVVEALAERDVERALVAVAHLTAAGFSPQQLTVDLVDHLRQGFLALVAPELVTVAGAERDALAAQAGRVGLATLVRAMEDLGRAQVAMRDAPDPRVNLEVALVRLAHPEADDSPGALLARIERLEPSGPRSAAAAPPPDAPNASGSPTGAAPAARAAAVPTGGRRHPSPTDPAGPDVRGAERAGVAAPGRHWVPCGASRPAADEGTTSTPTSGATAPPLPAASDEVPEPIGADDTAAVSTVPVAHPSEVSPPSGPDSPVPFPTRDELVRAWGDHVIGRLRPKAKALYQAGRFVAAEGGRAEFGLPNEIHRNRCEEMRPEIEAALAEQFGRPVPLVLVVDGAPPEPRPRHRRPAGPRPAPPPAPATTERCRRGRGPGRLRGD